VDLPRKAKRLDDDGGDGDDGVDELALARSV
jgi:hypothetical protein